MRLFLGFLIAATVTLTPEACRAQPPDNPTVIANSGHSKGIESFAFAPDGAWLATSSIDGTIKLWDFSSGRVLRTLLGHTHGVTTVVVTPDGRNLVSLSDDKTIKVWETQTGRLVRTITKLSDGNIDLGLSSALAVSNDGRFVYTSTFGAIRRFDIGSGTLQRKYPKLNADAYWQSFALSPDNRLIAAAHNHRSVRGAQLKLLDVGTGRVVRDLGVYSDDQSVTAVSFSPDGRLVAAAGFAGYMKVWDVASGRLLYTLIHSQKSSGGSQQVRFSPDSKTIVTAGHPDGVKFWDASTGQMTRSMSGEDYSASSTVAYSPDGRSLAIAHWEKILLTDAVTGARAPVSFGQRDASTISVAPVAPGQWLELGNGRFSVWDESSGQLIQSTKVDSDYVMSSEQFWARDAAGHVIVAMHGKNLSIDIWDATQGTLLRNIPWPPAPQAEKPCSTCGEPFLQNVSISPDARRVAAGVFGDPSGIRIWDVASGQQVKFLQTGSPSRFEYGGANAFAAKSIAFSPDSRSLATGVDDQRGKEWLKTWEPDSGRQKSGFALPDRISQPSGNVKNGKVVFAPDGRSVAMEVWYTPQGSQDTHDSIVTINPANGQVLRRFVPDKLYGFANVIRYSPDGRLIFVGVGESDTILVWDAASGRLAHMLAGNPGSPESIDFSSDGHRIIVGNQNSTVSIWSLDTFQRLATTLHARSGEWVTITPEGFFAASEHGAEFLHVVQGFETTGIDQVYQSLYRPDLVREKLAGDPRGLVREAAAQLNLGKVLASGNAPSVRLVSPAPAGDSTTEQIAAEVEVGDRGGGVGRIEWRVNGLTVGVDTAPAQTAPPLRLSRAINLAPGGNQIEVVAYNGSNLIASVPARATVAFAPAATSAATTPIAAAPQLFVLAAGVDNYADKRFRLALAVADAKDVALAFNAAGKGLYQAVEVKLLSDEEVTRERLDAAFKELAGRVRPGDVFVLYLAGHGKTVGGRYYFVPQNFRIDGEPSTAAVDAAVTRQGISQNEWQRWFAMVPARKSVILFDTCESGTLTADEPDTKALERGAANDRLAQATGRSIITASTGDSEAIEGYRGHGLFTYNVLDALDRSDGDGSGTVEVTELAAYVYAQVTALSEQVFKLRQSPQMKITLNYPLTRQTRVLPDDAPAVAANDKPKAQLAHTAQLQIKPADGATVVRSLAPKTAVTVLRSEGGWSLIAAEGKPLGYVATRDLAPMP